MKSIILNDFNLSPESNLENIPWTSANGFCMNSDGKFCIVFEKAKNYWCLPGGTKEVGETPIQTLNQEVREEAQAEAYDIQYFHAVYSKTLDKNGVEEPNPENMYCFRYICKLKNIQEFEPNKGGFEIDERKFVTVEELPEYITWLKDSENGRESYKILKSRLLLN